MRLRFEFSISRARANEFSRGLGGRTLRGSVDGEEDKDEEEDEERSVEDEEDAGRIEDEDPSAVAESEGRAAMLVGFRFLLELASAADDAGVGEKRRWE